MIEKFADLELDKADTPDEVEAILKEKLGISFTEMREALSKSTIEHAEELTHEFVNVAPNGDYSKLLEDNDSMAEFFKTEAHKPENWEIAEARPVDNKALPNMITFGFYNKAVDDGNTMNGFVYVSFEGKIKHAFAQGES